MKIAVTGGNGRFGRVVVRLLKNGGHDVLNIDQAASERHNSDVPFFAANMRDLDALTNALQGHDGVVHLAAIPSPQSAPAPEVYANNTIGSYHVLFACAQLGIKKVCLASSINSIGGAYSRAARYDYFPVDEAHPTYNEDAYSLSKWVLEAQADSFARRYEDMTLSTLRFHGLVPTRYDGTPRMESPTMVNHLWAYTHIDDAAKACELCLQATWRGHERFFIVGPRTVVTVPSLELAARFYPQTKLNGDLSGDRSFYDCSKAKRLLGWEHRVETEFGPSPFPFGPGAPSAPRSR